MAAAKKAVKEVYVYSNDGDYISDPFESVQEALQDADDEGNGSVTIYKKVARYEILTKTEFKEVK